MNFQYIRLKNGKFDCYMSCIVVNYTQYENLVKIKNRNARKQNLSYSYLTC